MSDQVSNEQSAAQDASAQAEQSQFSPEEIESLKDKLLTEKRQANAEAAKRRKENETLMAELEAYRKREQERKEAEMSEAEKLKAKAEKLERALAEREQAFAEKERKLKLQNLVVMSGAVEADFVAHKLEQAINEDPDLDPQVYLEQLKKDKPVFFGQGVGSPVATSQGGPASDRPKGKIGELQQEQDEIEAFLKQPEPRFASRKDKLARFNAVRRLNQIKAELRT